MLFAPSRARGVRIPNPLSLISAILSVQRRLAPCSSCGPPCTGRMALESLGYQGKEKAPPLLHGRGTQLTEKVSRLVVVSARRNAQILRFINKNLCCICKKQRFFRNQIVARLASRRCRSSATAVFRPAQPRGSQERGYFAFTTPGIRTSIWLRAEISTLKIT